MNSEWLRGLTEQLRPGGGKLLPTTLPDASVDAWDLVSRIAGVSIQELAVAVAAHFGLPLATQRPERGDPQRLLRWQLANKLQVLPLWLDGHTLHVAGSDPLAQTALDELHFVTGWHIAVEIQSPQWIEQEIVQAYGAAEASRAPHAIKLADTEALELGLEPAVRLAHHILHQALERRASDIHLQPYLGGYLARVRVDGVLARLATIRKEDGVPLIRYFKAQGGMDVTSPLVPHDGHATVFFRERRVNLRLSSLPNADGERLVVRLLDQNRVFSLDRLGYSPVRLQTLRRLTRLDSGLILFVGPTGCGKTTSLYGMLSSLNSMSRSIATLEDPVEYEVAGLSQVNVQSKQGLSFASALRAQLRQDPDVLLIGEIRDEETAEAAARAALTGHLVYSTLHSSSARFAVPRLLDLGLSAPVIGETLRAVVAQRLVRQLCPHCNHAADAPWTPSEDLFKEITLEIPARRAGGCSECHFTGYHGVVPVVEVYIPSDKERAALLAGQPSAEFWQEYEATGPESINPDERSMALQLRDMVVSGQTSADEASRALGSDFWHVLARHYEHMGWLKGEISDIALAALSSEEKMGVLVLSENPALAPELALAVRGWGLHVLTMEAGQDPHEFLAHQPNVGLLLVDVEGDDAQALQDLYSMRSKFAWSGIPAVVLVPGEDTILAEQLTLRLGARLLRKPVTIAHMAEVIRGLTLEG